MPQSLRGVKDALFDACTTLYAASVDANGAPALVTFGPPGSNQPNAIVAVAMATRQPITRPTIGPNRSREKTAEIDVVFSIYVPGGETRQQVADDACNDLTDLLESYFRTSPNETLSGTCREAWVSSITGPDPTVATNPATGVVTGRISEATATITAAIRY